MDNNCFDNRTMPPRRRPLCDINHEAHRYENGDDDLPSPPSSPPFNDGIHPTLVQFMADTTRHLAEAISWIPRPKERVEPTGCSLRDFSSYHFRTFEGIEWPNAAKAWLMDIDVLFNTLGCTDEQKVRYIGPQLDAWSWEMVEFDEGATWKRDSDHLGVVQGRIQQTLFP